MLDSSSRPGRLPNAAGVGFKPQHFEELMADPGPVKWVEVHAENYMGDGGRPHAQLRALSERFALSIHGVGLSIGGSAPLDLDHLARLKKLCDWAQPASFSEHLAWSSHGSEYLNDLLPLPYTEGTLRQVCAHIDQVQEALGRRMLLENPSSYLVFEESSLSEVNFLEAIVRRTGAGLLLDINNVYVSSTNLGISPQTYIDTYPVAHVEEIHVGGHDEDRDENGGRLLIDSHARPVADDVWDLLDFTLARTGPKPVLIEWDNDVPGWDELKAEGVRVASALVA